MTFWPTTRGHFEWGRFEWSCPHGTLWPWTWHVFVGGTFWLTGTFWPITLALFDRNTLGRFDRWDILTGFEPQHLSRWSCPGWRRPHMHRKVPRPPIHAILHKEDCELFIKIRELIPETGWCISEWVICDFQWGDGTWARKSDNRWGAGTVRRLNSDQIVKIAGLTGFKTL